MLTEMMLTVASVVIPAVTPGGRLRNPSFTDSPSSSSVSWVAVNVNDFEISPLLKVTLSEMTE